jgi:hypothetical protein
VPCGRLASGNERDVQQSSLACGHLERTGCQSPRRNVKCTSAEVIAATNRCLQSSPVVCRRLIEPHILLATRRKNARRGRSLRAANNTMIPSLADGTSRRSRSRRFAMPCARIHKLAPTRQRIRSGPIDDAVWSPFTEAQRTSKRGKFLKGRKPSLPGVSRTVGVRPKRTFVASHRTSRIDVKRILQIALCMSQLGG